MTIVLQDMALLQRLATRVTRCVPSRSVSFALSPEQQEIGNIIHQTICLVYTVYSIHYNVYTIHVHYTLYSMQCDVLCMTFHV